MTMPTKREIGTYGEKVASEWLVQHGYEILKTNYFARVGEIDIIAWHSLSSRLCFIEVKTRKKRTGEAEFAHSYAKQQKIRKAAEVYCQEFQINVDATHISFEHLSVYTEDVTYRIEHYVL